MTITTQDPASMTSEECLSEIAEVLAQGYLRLTSSQNELDESTKDEAPCGTVVNKQENKTAMEEIA